MPKINEDGQSDYSKSDKYTSSMGSTRKIINFLEEGGGTPLKNQDSFLGSKPELIRKSEPLKPTLTP